VRSCGESWTRPLLLLLQLCLMCEADPATAAGWGLGSIAEISLLGSLGCGRQLVSLVAEDLLAQGNYSYLVLQVLDAGLGWCCRRAEFRDVAWVGEGGGSCPSCPSFCGGRKQVTLELRAARGPVQGNASIQKKR
jgi:hypothetical protein